MGENCLVLDLDWIICSINFNLFSFMQQLLIVPSELTYGSKGVDIKVLKAEHVSLEMQIEFAQEIDIMRKGT